MASIITELQLFFRGMGVITSDCEDWRIKIDFSRQNKVEVVHTRSEVGANARFSYEWSLCMDYEIKEGTLTEIPFKFLFEIQKFWIKEDLKDTKFASINKFLEKHCAPRTLSQMRIKRFNEGLFQKEEKAGNSFLIVQKKNLKCWTFATLS